ncbi:MAG: PD-(D/E)XK nuclease family protein [Streptosporangiales bacterium]
MPSPQLTINSPRRKRLGITHLELDAALPRLGRFGDGVLVAPLSAAVGLDADVVYAVGLSEDLFPGRLHEDALLPDRVREHADGQLRSYRERIDAHHRHLLAAFASAPRVVASFPRGDLRRSSRRLPSRWLLHTLRALSGRDRLAATEWEHLDGEWLTTSPSYAGTVSSTDLPASEQEWRVRAATVDGLDSDEDVERAVAMIRARARDQLTRYDGNLTGATGLPDYAHRAAVVSPTALEAYATCPHAYFVERLLGVQPVEEPEELVTISPLDTGRLIHESMQDLVTEFADRLPTFGAEWTPLQKARLREIAEAKGTRFESGGLTGHPRLWQRERQRILADLAWMLDNDFEWRHQRSARVLASEMAFGMYGREAVVVHVTDGEVLMRGSADKVDQTAAGTLLVTDIKTGGSRRFRDLRDDPVAAGTKLQLPVYAYAARQLLGDPDTDVEAAYWFVRKDRGTRIPVELTPEVESVYGCTVGTLVASITAGLFPARAPAAPDFGWVQCPYCNPDGIGHSEVRGRWERKRHDPILRAYAQLVEPDAFAKVGR